MKGDLKTRICYFKSRKILKIVSIFQPVNEGGVHWGGVSEPFPQINQRNFAKKNEQGV